MNHQIGRAKRSRYWLGKEHHNTPKSTQRPTIRDIAYTAGFYDGEGCCSAKGTKADLSINLTQKDRGPLEWLARRFGGNIKEAPNRKRGNMYYRWSLHGARARGFAMTIYPMLSPRRQSQIKEALQRTVRRIEDFEKVAPSIVAAIKP